MGAANVEVALLLLGAIWGGSARAGSPAAPWPPQVPISPVRFEQNDWQRLLRYFSRTGPEAPRFTPSDGYTPATFGFEDIRGKRGEPHQADYFNLWGYEQKGRFAPFEVKLVSEDWREFRPEYTRDERARASCAKVRCLFVDQWIFTLGLDGAKTGSYHGSVIEDATGTVYGGDTFQAGEPEAKSKLSELLTRWTQVLDSRLRP